MKDRITFRFTVSTGELDGKIVKPIIKAAKPYLGRLAESVTKIAEGYCGFINENQKLDPTDPPKPE